MQELMYCQWIEYQKIIMSWQVKILENIKDESDSCYGIHISKVFEDSRFITPVTRKLHVIEKYYTYVIYDISDDKAQIEPLNTHLKNPPLNTDNIVKGRPVKLCFSHGEAQAYLSRLEKNQVESGVYIILPTLVMACLENSGKSHTLLKLLCERFISVISYEATVLTLNALNNAHWHWVIDGRDIFNVFIDNSHSVPVVYPPSWPLTQYGKNKAAHYVYGPISAVLLPVANKAGLWGLVDVNGQFIVSCQYAKINPTSACVNAQEFEVAIVEASTVKWSLIGIDGRQINPDGFSIIPSEYSVISSDIRVIKQNISPYLYGYISTNGNILGETKWKSAGIHEWECGAVQDANSGLYGFVDRQGVLAIACSYVRVSGFNTCSRYRTRYAMVAIQYDIREKPLWGCIDMKGNQLISPQWLDICEYTNGYMLVQSSTTTLEIITLLGESMGVSLKVTLADNIKNLYWALTDEQHDDLKKQLKAAIKDKFSIKLTCGMNLAILKNKIADENDFKSTELHGAQAILLSDIGNYDYLKKGMLVTIGYTYPATAGMYDFKQEVPVRNRQTNREHYGIGVPWEQLEIVK